MNSSYCTRQERFVLFGLVGCLKESTVANPFFCFLSGLMLFIFFTCKRTKSCNKKQVGLSAKYLHNSLRFVFLSFTHDRHLALSRVRLRLFSSPSSTPSTRSVSKKLFFFPEKIPSFCSNYCRFLAIRWIILAAGGSFSADTLWRQQGLRFRVRRRNGSRIRVSSAGDPFAGEFRTQGLYVNSNFRRWFFF